MTAIFQVGGTGARATKDGLNTTGFPSGVAGVPAEVIEHLSALVQAHRELRPDSGGPGEFRGGLGQATEYWYRGDGPWSMSAMADRTKFPAQGIAGGGDGALGILAADGEPIQPKTVVMLKPGQRVLVALPGGGGYGDPFRRATDAVLADVVSGYVTIEGAERDYGVVVKYLGTLDQLVRLPEHYAVDEEATARLRAARAGR
jgi:N-methylhydantoinase B